MHVAADSQDSPRAPDTSRDLAIKARDASRKLQALPSEARADLLHQIADAIESNQDTILEENGKDCQVAVSSLCVDRTSRSKSRYQTCFVHQQERAPMCCTSLGLHDRLHLSHEGTTHIDKTSNMYNYKCASRLGTYDNNLGSPSSPILAVAISFVLLNYIQITHIRMVVTSLSCLAHTPHGLTYTVCALSAGSPTVLFIASLGSHDQVLFIASLGSHDQALGSHDQALGSHDQALGSHDQGLGSRDQSLGSHDQALGSHDQSLGVP